MSRVVLIAGLVLLATALAGAAAGEVAVSFPASDGVRLAGTLFGGGPAAVVLSHMFPTDQASWFPFARRLAGEGYGVLAYDFRGYGKSGGARQIQQIDRDARAAAQFVRTRGARRVALVGASMGGTASVKAAAALGADALVVISSPMSFRGLTVSASELARLTMPSLWITSEGDSVTASMRAMHAAAAGPKTLQIYPGSAHGTYLFDSPYAEDVARRIIGFLTQHVPPR